MALALFGNGMARIPVSFSVLTTVLGGISSIVLVIYIISPPGVPTFGEAAVEVSLGRKIGVWLGLASAIALAVGGYKTMQEEGTSFADAADRLSSGRGHQPEAPLEHEPQQPDYQQPPPPHDYQAPPHASSLRLRTTTQAPPPPPPPPPQGYSRDGSPGSGRGEHGGDLLRKGDDRHHRVDPDRGREEGAVGDVEVRCSVHRAVAGADPFRGSAAIRAVPIGWKASRRSSEGLKRVASNSASRPGRSTPARAMFG